MVCNKIERECYCDLVIIIINWNYFILLVELD